MKNIKIPVIIIASILLGLWIGNIVAKRAYSTNSLTQLSIGGKKSKLDELLTYTNKAYVDTLDIAKLTEDIVIDFVKKLDPHSAYIPAKDLEMVNSELGGSFSGIGVQFNIQNDTIMIVGVISGGPSEKVGVLAGDRIIMVNDSVFVGKDINNEKVMSTLRGMKDTEVKIGIKRQGTADMLEYTIMRGDIPLHSVDVAYMIRPRVGFIRVSKFSETTYAEFLNGLAKLRSEGAERYVIDLRENTGGYMDQAINMANEFLHTGELIVYSEGKAYPRYEAKSNGRGSFRNVPVVVLIDEFSASASEIFAGAIQDNDRGLIVGRRSFGKGLVQQQMPFSDGSALRLTVARYHTPSGRCIQKPYEMGKSDEYQLDIINRFEHGEFDNKDSIQFSDTTIYKTTSGRVVYSGGGIMPDIFVPRDTTGYTPYLSKVLNRAYTYQFAFKYTDMHRATLSEIKSWKEMQRYLDNQNLLADFVAFASEKGVAPNQKEINISKKIILRTIKSYIIRNILNDDGFYPVFFQDDKIILEAIKAVESLNGNSVVGVSLNIVE